MHVWIFEYHVRLDSLSDIDNVVLIGCKCVAVSFPCPPAAHVGLNGRCSRLAWPNVNRKKLFGLPLFSGSGVRRFLPVKWRIFPFRLWRNEHLRDLNRDVYLKHQVSDYSCGQNNSSNGMSLRHHVYVCRDLIYDSILKRKCVSGVENVSMVSFIISPKLQDCYLSGLGSCPDIVRWLLQKSMKEVKRAPRLKSLKKFTPLQQLCCESNHPRLILAIACCCSSRPNTWTTWNGKTLKPCSNRAMSEDWHCIYSCHSQSK